MRFTQTCFLALSLSLFAGCSDSDDGATPPADTGGGDTAPSGDTATNPDTATSGDAGDSATPTDTATSEGGETSSGFKLTVQNYLAWCTVSVNGGATSTAAEQVITVPAGTVVNLVGEKIDPFFWGYWRNTAGDTTAAHDTAKTTTVTITKDTVVQACCPTASGGTCPDPT